MEIFSEVIKMVKISTAHLKWLEIDTKHKVNNNERLRRHLACSHSKAVQTNLKYFLQNGSIHIINEV